MKTKCDVPLSDDFLLLTAFYSLLIDNDLLPTVLLFTALPGAAWPTAPSPSPTEHVAAQVRSPSS